MMDSERAANLLAKYVAGELTPDEKEEMEWELHINPSLKDTLKALQGLHAFPSGSRTGEEAEMLERGLSRFRSRQSALPLYEDGRPAARME